MIMSWNSSSKKLRTMKLSPAAPLTILTCVVTMGLASANGGDCPDQYVYTKQPPQELWICNPYLNGELNLTCSVIGENVTDIQWWFAPSISDDGEHKLLTNGSKYALRRIPVEGGLEMQLTVRDLGGGDVGLYWCQASVVDALGVQLLSTSEAVPLNDQEDFMEDAFPCNFIPKNSQRRCASIIITETASVAPTSLPEPSSSSSSSPPLTTSPAPTSLPPSSPPVSVSPPPQSLLGGSSVILYAVLGLVGFLAVVCVSLCVIVIILCRRRCSRAAQKSSSVEKEMAFETFSDQNGPSLGYKHIGPMQFIHSETHSRTLSGEYAEIGPALSQSLERGYSQIGGVLHTCLPPIPNEMDPKIDELPTPGYENPYDLPIFPFGQGARESDVALTKSQEMGEMESADSKSLGSHGYHVLEQITPLNSAATSPPLVNAQHTYHVLEDPGSSPWLQVSSCDQGNDVDFALDDDAYDDIIQRDPSPRLSCSSGAEPVRLPTIPESEAEDDCTVEVTDIIRVTSLVGREALSPNIVTGPRENSAKCSNDDEGYDRLVDPPHLYHILEHSPSTGCPRVHSFPPSVHTYGNLEEAGHTANRKPHLLPHVHLLSTQGGLSNLTYSSGSSLDGVESTAVFDDPQYLPSPERTRIAKLSRGMDRSELQQRSLSYMHTQPYGPSCIDQTTEPEAQGDITLLKYSGDYERDPLYMRRLHHDVIADGRHVRSEPNSRQQVRDTDESLGNDDSGFSTFSGSLCGASLQDRDKGSSLPNLNKHVYQSLEAETLEPLQPYDKLNKETYV